MYVGATLTALGIVIALSAWDDVDPPLQLDIDSGPSQSGFDPDAVLTVGVPVGVLYALVLLALWVWMAVANRRGRGWARTVATILGAIVVLLWVPDPSAWYRSCRAYPRSG